MSTARQRSTSALPACGAVDVSVPPVILEHMFDDLVAVDPSAGEAALVERIAELERIKSAAAAGQARAAAALDALRRSNEADAGVPAAQRGRGWRVRLRWRDGIPWPGVAGISDSRRRWCTRCPTRSPRWRRGGCPSGG